MKTVQYSEKKLITYEEIQVISLLNFRLKQKIKLPHTVITHIETFVSNTSKYQWKIAQCVLISAELSDYQFIFCTQKNVKKGKSDDHTRISFTSIQKCSGDEREKLHFLTTRHVAMLIMSGRFFVSKTDGNGL